jgi:hypothetical protein
MCQGELDEKVVVSKMEITTVHGAIAGKTQKKSTGFYNLSDPRDNRSTFPACSPHMSLRPILAQDT